MENTKRVYFVGDVHLDARIPERERAFCAFLNNLNREKIDALYLMGDIFEFWFGYNNVMFAKPVKVISLIACLVENGVDVHYIVGNHDFHPGPVFSDYLGVKVSYHPMTIRLGGKKVYLSHGDEINTQDQGYLLLKKILRNRIAQYCFKCIPASLAWFLGRFTSDASRKITTIKSSIPEPIYRLFVENQIRLNNVDVIIHGHTHEPGCREFESEFGNALVINSGHWFGPGYAVRFDSGGFELLEIPI